MKHFKPQKIADSLTSEQYLKLIEFIHGPVDPVIAAMTDDELLSELSQ